MRQESSVLNAYFAKHSISRIVVVSPHLDDAAFSLSAFLSLPNLPNREVVTVFTAANSDSDARHAHAMGFDDPVHEFDSRRQEDEIAMARLGVPYVHVGAIMDDFSQSTVDLTLGSVKGRESSECVMLLLPLGAGGKLNKLERLWRRLIRKPMGCPSHGDHIRIRDEIGRACRQKQLRYGYYAEVPYQWANTPQSMMNAVRQFDKREFTSARIFPDVDHKLEIARAYESQIQSEFGRKVNYQKKTISIPELLILPV